MFGWCPWSSYDGEPIDAYDIDRLDLPWSEERRRRLGNGEAAPNETELGEWRHAMCRWSARENQNILALIKPLRMEDGKIEAFEVWLDRHPDNPAWDERQLKLFGIFDSIEEAKSALMAEGALADAQ
jgi:hypothetical protein